MTGNHNEAQISLRVYDLLLSSGWDKNFIEAEHHIRQDGQSYFADYILKDDQGAPIAVIECKRSTIDPYIAKQQAEPYARSINAPFIFLSNAEKIYFYDYEKSDARLIEEFFSQEDLQRRKRLRSFSTPLSELPYENNFISKGKTRTLREYQVEAMKAMDYAWELGKTRFLLQMPTGTGKTACIVSYLKRLLKSENVERVLILVDRSELAKQAIDSVGDLLPEYSSYWLKAGMKVQHKQITVCLIQTMMNKYNEFSSGYFDVVVADECHRSIYGVWQVVLNRFDSFHIGMTATPNEYIDKNTFRFYRCKDDTPDYFYGIKEAFQKEYLIPYTFSKSITKVLQDGIDVDDEHYEPSEFYRKFINNPTNELMVNQFEREANEIHNTIAPGQEIGPGKTIVFAINKRHAADLTKLFNEKHPELKGGYAQIITSDTPNVEQRIIDFKTKDYPQIAVSVGMLDTGFDCPEVIHIIMARPIRSAILYQQIRGRGTRTAPWISKNRFMIYDFFGNHDYFNDTDTDPYVGGGGGFSPGGGDINPEKRVLKELDIEDEWIYQGEMIEYGPNGEQLDREGYITAWQESVLSNASDDELLSKIKNDQDLSEEDVNELSKKLNSPKMYFNEENLRKAYKQPLASIVDFVKHVLETKPLKTIEQQIEENFDAWLITQELNSEQTEFIKLLKNRFVANGKADIEDLFEPPLSYFNAGQKGVDLFGEELLVDLIDDLNQNIFKRAI